jgi:CheY-like chemotaxis protein
LLEKWGHTPVIAEDGREALSLLDTDEFDVILMDLQMPEINGFEATARIRQKERGTDRHIPIIALTAHALKGDRERCIEAGMDDYVSKPIEGKKLFDVVETAVRRGRRANGNGGPHKPPLDLDALIENFDGDRELVSMLAGVLEDSCSCQLSEMNDAVTRGDAEGLARAAHKLKGSVANFCADAAVDAANRLEGIAQTGNLSIAAGALAVLEKEIERLREELQAFEKVGLL